MDPTDAMSLASAPFVEQGSQGCVLIAFSYDDVASVVEPVVRDAAARILAQPAAGDFVEIRFAGCGDRLRPGRAAGHLAPDEADSVESPFETGVDRSSDEVAERVTAVLAASEPAADESYFALVAVDQSATEALRMLAACQGHPVLRNLSPRCSGFVVVDDQTPGSSPTGDEPEIITAPSGEWTSDTLAEEFVRYADQLFAHYAATHVPGVTREQFAAVQEWSVSGGDRPGTGSPGVGPGLDLSPVDSGAGQHSRAEPGGGRPGRAEPGDGKSQETALSPPAGPQTRLPPAPEPARRSFTRWRPPWRRDHDGSPSPAGSGPVAPTGVGALTDQGSDAVAAADTAAPGVRLTASAAEPATVSTYLYVLLHEEQGDHGRSPWRRRRGRLLDLDQELAANLPGQVRMRVFSGRDGAAGSPLALTGDLSARNLKEPDPSSELAAALDRLGVVLDRDVGTGGADGSAAVRPMIVIVAPMIPVADVITAQAFARAAARAPICWVLGDMPVDQVSSPLAGDGVQTLPDGDDLGAQLVGLIISNAAQPEIAAGS